MQKSKDLFMGKNLKGSSNALDQLSNITNQAFRRLVL